MADQMLRPLIGMRTGEESLSHYGGRIPETCRGASGQSLGDRQRHAALGSTERNSKTNKHCEMI